MWIIELPGGQRGSSGTATPVLTQPSIYSLMQLQPSSRRDWDGYYANGKLMSFWGRSNSVNFLETCYGALHAPRLTVTRGMPCVDLDLWRRGNREISCLFSLLLLLCLVNAVEASFMHDSKVHFSPGSGDHWTLRDRARLPSLVHMTVCVHLRVLVAGEWTAYTYGHPQARTPDLALQGDRDSLYFWLLGMRHRFPVHLLPRRWYRVCLERDASRHRVSLSVDGSPSVRTVVAEAVPPMGELVLGRRGQMEEPPSGAGEVELYMFRMWDDVGQHGVCEDGGMVAWRSEQWLMGDRPPLRDERLPCGPRRERRNATSEELFANTSSAANFTLTPATSTNYTTTQTTGPLTLHCSFPEFCANKSAFYWFVLTIQSTDGLTSEVDIRTWLSRVYVCVQSDRTASSDYSNSPGSRGERKCQKENETTVDLFQEFEFSCDDKEKIRKTNCTVLLHLSRLTDPCVLLKALQDSRENSTFQAHLLGRVERVGRGLCYPEERLNAAGSFEKCSSSPPLSDICYTKGPGNVTCNRYAESVVVPVDSDSPWEQNCNQIEEHRCDCFAFCNDTAAYYALTIGVTDPHLTFSHIRSLIYQLGIDPLSCIDSTPETRKDGFCTSTISKVYQETHLECLGMRSQINSCTMVLKLAKNMPICTIRATLVSLFQNSEGIYYNSPLTRVAICGWPSGSSINMSIVNFTLISTNLDLSQICDKHSSINYTCKNGETLAVFLSEICMPDPNPPTFSTTPPQNSTHSPNRTTSHVAAMDNTMSTTHGPPQNTTTPTLQSNKTALPLKTTTPWNITTAHSTKVNTTGGVQPTNAAVSPLKTTTAKSTTSIAALSTSIASKSTNPFISPVKSTAGASVNTTRIPSTTAPVTTVNSEVQAELLLNLTRDVSSLNSSQVEQLVTQLEDLLSGPNVSLPLGQTVVTIVSNLLNASVSALASSSNRLIGVVDTVGLKLVMQGETETILSDSVAVAVKKVDGANFEETSFFIINPSDVQISSSLRAKMSSTPQGSITLPASLTNGLNPQQQMLASRVQFNFYQRDTVFQDRDLQGRRLNSGILGTSVANLSISSLVEDIVITLRNSEPVSANFVASCVFWDFSRNGGLGGWNPSGCSVKNSTVEETVCSCNHLTSFAVLLDISRGGITSREQSIILTYISYIGCGISAIFLSITLLTYLAFGKLRKDIPSKILIELCTALLLLNLTFLLDSWLALYPDAVGLCISTAFFLHYFLLVSFTWMGLEALHMYLAIVKVFNTYVSRYMLKFSLVGWGVPLIVVIIVIAIDKDNYGLISYGNFADGSTDEFCWLRNDVAFYVAVVAYFCMIFLVNLAMFVVVMVQLWRIRRQNPHNGQQRSRVHELRSVAGLTVLLGLTWGFAFFAWGPVNLAFMYLFTIFNSLQGIFIFIFHCAIKESVRKQWRTYLCCGKLRLAEHTEWSRTATRRTVNRLPANRAASYGSSDSVHSSQTSSTSFLASDSTERPNLIGSTHVDRQIISLEEPNQDVVLNEIHSRHRTPRGQ
ncbi:hypothetical protein AAFF_G00102570 [Aldrovandia affinis]|uniref:Adhesion G-protein coupled receptor G2 n=1 Tax=Aldrovandia affinis TaxID=143900 RepID=A0AAD7RX66_9TELE|nr:hypothetical protein AAFF_G00102570 [Aldrovandia affinis]